MKNFSFLQRFRNKIRVDKSTILSIAKSSKIVDCSITIKGKNNHLIVADLARLRGATLEIIGNDCFISIGENSMVGDNCYLSAKEEKSRLVIGADCGLSRNVKIMTSDGHPIYQNNQRVNYAKDIEIEEHVWIAYNVTILKGVTIQSGSVIGINSTVVKSIPNNSVAAGNPCRVIKENIVWKDKF